MWKDRGKAPKDEDFEELIHDETPSVVVYYPTKADVTDSPEPTVRRDRSTAFVPDMAGFEPLTREQPTIGSIDPHVTDLFPNKQEPLADPAKPVPANLQSRGVLAWDPTHRDPAEDDDFRSFFRPDPNGVTSASTDAESNVPAGAGAEGSASSPGPDDVQAQRLAPPAADPAFKPVTFESVIMEAIPREPEVSRPVRIERIEDSVPIPEPIEFRRSTIIEPVFSEQADREAIEIAPSAIEPAAEEGSVGVREPSSAEFAAPELAAPELAASPIATPEPAPMRNEPARDEAEEYATQEYAPEWFAPQESASIDGFSVSAEQTAAVSESAAIDEPAFAAEQPEVVPPWTPSEIEAEEWLAPRVVAVTESEPAPSYADYTSIDLSEPDTEMRFLQEWAEENGESEVRPSETLTGRLFRSTGAMASAEAIPALRRDQASRLPSVAPAVEIEEPLARPVAIAVAEPSVEPVVQERIWSASSMSGIKPSAVYLITVAATCVAGLINSLLLGPGLGWFTGLVLILAALAMSLRVRLSDAIAAVSAPPLAFLAAALTVGQIGMSMAGGPLIGAANNVFVALSSNAIWIVGATATALIVVILRARRLR